MQIPGYPKVWNLGHSEIAELLHGSVVIQEKVDGSQFSFANFEGKLLCRSKGAAIGEDSSLNSLFGEAVKTAKLIFDTDGLAPGTIVRGECLRAPRHNTLAYSRVPRGHIAVFDIESPWGRFLSPAEVRMWCENRGLEAVPTFYEGEVRGVGKFVEQFLKQQSFLGGALVEGVVIKNYQQLTPRMGQVCMGKFVSEAFKETNKANWKSQSRQGKVEQLIDQYRTEARWHKAIQHLAEQGTLLNEPKDIGSLIGEIKRDLLEEAGEEISRQLFKGFYGDVEKGVLRGFPEWYKKLLMEKQDEQPQAGS